MYRERAPRPDGAVVWTRKVRVAGGPTRILPDGCMDVIWVDGELFVAGPDTEAHLITSPGGTEFVAVRFAPGTAPDLLGVPALELRNQHVRLDALWPEADVRRLSERIWEAPDRGGTLSSELGVAPVEPWVRWLVTRLRAGSPVATLAGDVALSERQLHRRSLFLFGYGPKMLSRILRLGRALDLARGGASFGSAAASAGYADQAHLSREVKALAGIPLGELVPKVGAGPSSHPPEVGSAAKRSTWLPSGSTTVA
jgi:AraC-like DNA-binding protein